MKRYAFYFVVGLLTFVSSSLTTYLLPDFNLTKSDESHPIDLISSKTNNSTFETTMTTHNLRRIQGCWNGMGGGKLKIENNIIFDLGSMEYSPFIELAIKVDSPLTGMETGEKYLVKTKEDFPKSFLSKIILFSFLSDGTVGITSYETYEDFEKDKITGMGLFGKVKCTNKK